MAERQPPRRWHALAPDQVLEALSADDRHGLDESGVQARRQRHGRNELTPAARRTLLRRFLSQFNNLFIWLLLAAGVITALLGEWLDSTVIFGVVLVIALIGFIQEGRAERALEAVRGMLSRRAWVLRDGRRQEIPAEDLVPGDIVLLEAGERVPADARLLRVRDLQVAEAALTGESEPVAKQAAAVATEAELGDRASMAYLGTLVTAGQGSAVVVATGDATEIGRISGLLAGIEQLRTPLMRRLDGFTQALSGAILALAAATFAVGTLVWGRPWAEMFFAAVSLAVAAIPEGLPAVMTVTLAIGVERMARRNAIIRRLPAVETLGAVTVICSDKTGTLTRNEMTVKTLRVAGVDLAVEGVGYRPVGGFACDGAPVEPGDFPVAMMAARAALLCNDGGLHQRGDGDWEPQGDPTEAALVVLAHKAGLDVDREHKEIPRLDVIPFASERRYMATLNHDHAGHHCIFVKGAPERVLEMCSRQAGVDGEPEPLDVEAWAAHVDEIAARGQRVLALARRRLEEPAQELLESGVEQELELLGLLGLIDPPREEAVRAVATCQSAGIRVKMITGDHALTAQAIARELGLENSDRVLTGRDLDGIPEDELPRLAAEVDVFARTSPEHKLRLVAALQSSGEVAAMTGDGVNDAPALKRADVGIAMGHKGTEAAREAAEMVLADDNFASIENAVEEGRTVYDNLRKAILFILPTNAAQAAVIVAAILLGLDLPVTPVQILWVNMITAITLGIAFAWEPAEGEIMSRPPRQPEEPLLTGFVLWRVGFVSLLLLAGVVLMFLAELGRPETSLEFARTVAVNALVMGQVFYLFNSRYLDRPSWTIDGLTGNRVVLLAIAACLLLQLLLTYLPLLNRLFGTAPLDAAAWLRCMGLGLLVFIVVELEKALRSRLGVARRSRTAAARS